MNFTFQDLDVVRPKIQKAFKDNPRRSLSSMFRDVRSMASLTFFGDFPIQSMIIRLAKENSSIISYKQLWLMCQKSSEYKRLKGADRQLWLRNLSNI